MNDNLLHEKIILTFYTALANKDITTMLNCYHPKIVYEDVGFGTQKGKRAECVWRLLLEIGDINTKIVVENIQSGNRSVSAKWNADYVYGSQKRPVHNIITATFRFQEGKIIYHKDNYSLWKWSKQSLGIFGWLFGWSWLFKQIVRKELNKSLTDFMNKNGY